MAGCYAGTLKGPYCGVNNGSDLWRLCVGIYIRFFPTI